MEKSSHFVSEPSVKRVMKELPFDLNEMPEYLTMDMDTNEKTNDDAQLPPPLPPQLPPPLPPQLPSSLPPLPPPLPPLPPPLPFYIDLCFPNEDMEVLKQKYKVLSSSSSVVISNGGEHFRKLGFHGGCETMMRIRDKRAQMTRNSLHALGRSWFKEITKKDKGQGIDWMVSLPEPLGVRRKGNKDEEKGKEDDADNLAAKELLMDFVNQAKARASAIRKKGKKVVRATIKKKKFVPKRRNLNAILSIGK